MKDWMLRPLARVALDGPIPSIVVTAGFAPLVDERDDLARKLAGAGVQVRFAGAVHGARRAVDGGCDDIVEIASSGSAVLP